jgi:hypothetical protein
MAALHCRIDRATTLMTQHDGQMYPQMLRRIFQAAEHRVVWNIAREANHKLVAQALIEKQFRRNP